MSILAAFFIRAVNYFGKTRKQRENGDENVEAILLQLSQSRSDAHANAMN